MRGLAGMKRLAIVAADAGPRALGTATTWLAADDDAAIDSLRGRGLECLAVGLCIGIALAWNAPPLAWSWLAAGVIACVFAWILRRRPRLALLMLAIAAASIGGSRTLMQQHAASHDDLAGMIGGEPELVRMRGVALRRPELRDRTAGSLGMFDYRPPSMLFPLRVESLQDRRGEPHAIHGKVLVRVDQTIPPLRAGDRVELSGFLERPASPRNPGDFDYRRHARALGQAGVAIVPTRDLLTIEPLNDPPLLDRFRRWRDELRSRAGSWVVSNLVAEGMAQREAFLAAMLLGERDPQLDALEQSFQRTGLAHLLAISGLNLAILAGFVLMLVRAGGMHRRWHGWLIVAVTLTYLLLIEARTPVLRAGVMCMIGGAGIAMGRRLSAGGLLALAAMILLLWRPDQLFNAGFQLSFAVVGGLIHLTGPLRERWFGEIDHAEAWTLRSMLAERLKTALTGATIAWLVATPIQMAHFGTISPLGVPLTLLSVPLVTLLLLLGYVKLLLSVALPSAGMLIDWPLNALADAMMWLVRAGESIPGSVIELPSASAAWALAAEACIIAWALHRSLRARRLLRLALVALLLWFVLPQISLSSSRPLVRIDMLFVNDGSCYVFRSGGRTVMFDAGASPDLNAARRSIVPAMKKLGVRRLDAVVVSHANLDHFSCVLELRETFGDFELIVTPQFLERAAADEHGPAAALLTGMRRLGSTITAAVAGDTRQFGMMRWTWLHPAGKDLADRVNNESCVVRIETGALGRRILMCGDIQRNAIAQLMEREEGLWADVLELPHHGAFTEAAAALMERVRPAIALQSTGERRLRGDRWPEALGDARRLITVRDGACWVEIDRQGGITAGALK